MNSKEYISSGIIESYILGLASPEEAGILECVMKNNAEVRAAFEETQKIMEDLATAQAVTPPSELKAKIWNRIKQEESELSALNEEKHNKINETAKVLKERPVLEMRKAKKWKDLAIAASVLFLVSIGANLFWMNTQNKKQEEIEQLNIQNKTQDLALQKIQQKWNMISNPDMQTVPLKGVEKHSGVKAMVFWDKKTKNVYLNAGNLPKAPEGMQYQLWAIADGKPISAGLYSTEKDSELPLSVVVNAQTFAITLEKAGGSEVPTMENMYVIGGV